MKASNAGRAAIAGERTARGRASDEIPGPGDGGWWRPGYDGGDVISADGEPSGDVARRAGRAAGIRAPGHTGCWPKTLALNDFYGLSEAWPYPMGHIQMLGRSDDWQIKAAAPRGLGWAPPGAYGDVAKHSIDSWLTGEDIPLPDSRVTLRRDGAIRLALQPGSNTEALTRLRTTFQETLASLGMVDATFVRSLYLHKAFDAAATAHQAGMAQFGTDPATSVLDVHCKAHDLDNLYLAHGSFMPSIGA
jgi:GMC oxidoreductase